MFDFWRKKNDIIFDTPNLNSDIPGTLGKYETKKIR